MALFSLNCKSMEALRKIVTVKDNKLTVQLPDIYNGKKVELIILSTEEFPPSQFQEKKSDYHKLHESIKLDMTIEEINKELKELRGEWEREIA
jgi:hypothetical protein